MAQLGANAAKIIMGMALRCVTTTGATGTGTSTATLTRGSASATCSGIVKGRAVKFSYNSTLFILI